MLFIRIRFNDEGKKYNKLKLLNYYSDQLRMGNKIEIHRINAKNANLCEDYTSIFVALAKEKKKNFQAEVFKRSNQQNETLNRKMLAHQSEIRVNNNFQYLDKDISIILMKYIQSSQMEKLGLQVKNFLEERINSNFGQKSYQITSFFTIVNEGIAMVRFDFLLYFFQYQQNKIQESQIQNLLLIDYIVSSIDTKYLGYEENQRVTKIITPRFFFEEEIQRKGNEIFQKSKQETRERENLIKDSMDKNKPATTQVLIGGIMKMMLNKLNRS